MNQKKEGFRASVLLQSFTVNRAELIFDGNRDLMGSLTASYLKSS